MTHQQAADAVGRSRPAASNPLRLLNLAKPVQELLMAGDLDMGMRARCCRSMAPARSSSATRSPRAASGARHRAAGAADPQPAPEEARAAARPRPAAPGEEIADAIGATGEDQGQQERCWQLTIRSAASTSSTACSAGCADSSRRRPAPPCGLLSPALIWAFAGGWMLALHAFPQEPHDRNGGAC